MSDDTRGQLIEIGKRLLMTESYSGFSYADLARRLGITKAAIHHHFPKKTDLAAAIVRRYRDRFRMYAEVVCAEKNPVERIDAYFGLFREMLETGGACPFGVLSTEFEHLPAYVRDELNALGTYHNEWLAEAVAQGRAAGLIRGGGPPTEVAHTISSMVQGAVLAGRSLGLEAYDRATAGLRSLLILE